MEYPDSNGNGVPDVFENRLPLSEILNQEPSTVVVVDSNSIIVELEIGQRAPRKGELYFLGGVIQRREYADSQVTVTIVKRIIAAPPDFPFQPEGPLKSAKRPHRVR